MKILNYYMYTLDKHGSYTQLRLLQGHLTKGIQVTAVKLLHA